LSDEVALLEELEEVIKESRKLRVRLALLQRQLDFYPLLSHSATESKPLPEPMSRSPIAGSTFARQTPGLEGDGIFGGLRTVPPNPEPVRLLPTSPPLPVRAQSSVDAPEDVDQLEPVAALAVGV
jgi:hypothetical protein